MAASYQDVDWGYSVGEEPITQDPLPLSSLNEHLARFGYQMRPIDVLAPPSRLIHWLKDGANPITLAAPQYRAEGYDNLVYDLHDIRDMLKHLHSEGIGEGHKLVAKRRIQKG